MPANSVLAKLAVEISANSTKFTQGMTQTRNEVSKFSKQVSSLQQTIVAAFTLNAIKNVGSHILEVTSKFQRFEAVLTNTLGSSSQAKAALKDIEQFAAQTPFGVDELTESFVKLANQGFKPTIAQMRQLGDLAASQGKSFNQLTEAIIDAQTGEFERLKEFGIRASKEGDKVKFTFKGVQEQVDFTNESIRNYILSLGDAEGVAGGMEAISKTLGGQLSNLGDSFEALFHAIGQGNSGIFSVFIGLLNKSVSAVANFIKEANADPLMDAWLKRNNEELEKFNKLNKQGKIEATNTLAQTIQSLRKQIEEETKFYDALSEASVKKLGLKGALDLANTYSDTKFSLQDINELLENQDFDLQNLQKNYDALVDLLHQYMDALAGINAEEKKRAELMRAVKTATKFKPGTSDTGELNVPGEYSNTEENFEKKIEADTEALIKHTEAWLGLGAAIGTVSFNYDEWTQKQEDAMKAAEREAALFQEVTAVAENMAYAIASGQQTAVQAIANATFEIIDYLLKQAMAAAITAALKSGGPLPVGLALAAVGIAAVRGLFAKAVGRTGGGGGGGAGVSSVQKVSNDRSPVRGAEQIELGGTIVVNGEKLAILLRNVDDKTSMRRG